LRHFPSAIFFNPANSSRAIDTSIIAIMPEKREADDDYVESRVFEYFHIFLFLLLLI